MKRNIGYVRENIIGDKPVWWEYDKNTGQHTGKLFSYNPLRKKRRSL